MGRRWPPLMPIAPPSAASWIVRRHEDQRESLKRDHACAECVPGGDSVKVGFRCYYHEALKLLGHEGVTSGMASMMDGAPTIYETLMRAFNDHYWDSLEPQKALLLKHIEGALRWMKLAGPQDESK